MCVPLSFKGIPFEKGVVQIFGHTNIYTVNVMGNSAKVYPPVKKVRVCVCMLSRSLSLSIMCACVCESNKAAVH